MTGGLYIHIPYCRKKCLYCDFFSGGVSQADWSLLRRSLLNELKERSDELPNCVTSIYFGGGTPSSMPVDELNTLLKGVRETVAERLSEDFELTLEVNPEDVNEGSIQAWKDMGFNRISIGIQTFDYVLLRSVGRRHSGEEGLQALKLLCGSFHNVSADLIFGLPGQSVEGVRKDVQTLLSCRPTHISVYSLMFEPGTALTVLRDSGKVKGVNDEVAVEMFDEISRLTAAAGYGRYEISNYSLPGFESCHNSLYWSGAPYLGLGPSAHSYDGDRIRRANPRDLKGYLRRFGYGEVSEVQDIKKGCAVSPPLPEFFSEERLSSEELREEFLLTRLRRRQGFELQEYRRRFGEDRFSELLKKATQLSEAGLINLSEECLALSENGIMVEDRVLLELAE